MNISILGKFPESAPIKPDSKFLAIATIIFQYFRKITAMEDRDKEVTPQYNQ